MRASTANSQNEHTLIHDTNVSLESINGMKGDF